LTDCESPSCYAEDSDAVRSEVRMPDDAVLEAPFSIAEILEDGLPARIDILDVGAYAEGVPRFEPLTRIGIGRVVGFDANPEAAAEAEAALPPGSRVLPYALGDGSTKTLHLTYYRGCSSLFEPNAEVIDMFESMSAVNEDGNFRIVDRLPVSTYRLDDIEECPKPDFVKLDVQGAELMILENGREKISDAVVIETEVEFVEVYRGQPLFGELQMFMRDQGYVLHKLVDISGRNFRPIATNDPTDATSQFLWADAVFVKDFSKLDRFTPQQMLKAAIILHEVYLSYDLAHIFLFAYDYLGGSEFAAAYRDAIGLVEELPRAFANVRRQL